MSETLLARMVGSQPGLTRQELDELAAAVWRATGSVMVFADNLGMIPSELRDQIERLGSRWYGPRPKATRKGVNRWSQ